MSETTLNTNQLKELLKTAIVEILQEQKEVFTDIIVEAMEDIALVKAIEEGEKTETVSREAIFKILSQQS
jgi:thermostable 8-oxoguanine DNA glycosylase